MWQRSTPSLSQAHGGWAPHALLLAEKCDLGSIITVFCHWFPWLIPAPAGQQALPLDLKPIMWWWSCAGGCECDAFGWERSGKRINHQTVSKNTLWSLCYLSVSSYSFTSFPHLFSARTKKKFEFLINEFDHHNQPRSILCFCLPSRILKSHLICKTNQCNNNHSLLSIHATPT